MVARTRLDVTLNVQCLSCCTLSQSSMHTHPFSWLPINEAFFASLHSSGWCIISHSRVFIFLSFIHEYCRYCLNINFWVWQLVSIMHNSIFELHFREWHGFSSPWIIFLSTLSHIFQCFFTHEYVTFLSQSRACAPFLFNSTSFA
jgi:hypothetical protein